MLNAAIPKLLAKENIDVIYGNYDTAFFDVEKRQLGMPMRADQDKDIESLFYLHEVGHALHTPSEGWHESVVEMDIPRDILNIVEDARIEKLVLREYPGAVRSFKNGYSKLVEKKFFGEINDEIVSDFNLIDRLNIKCKLRDLINVEFSAEEIVFYQRALTLETWEDVLILSQDLVDFIEAQRPDPNTDGEEADQQNEEQSGAGEEDSRGEEILEDWKQRLDDALEEGDPEKINKLFDEAIQNEYTKNAEEKKEEEKVESPDVPEDLQSKTDREFKKNERQVNTELDRTGVIVSSSLKRRDLDTVVIPYETLRTQRPRPETVQVMSYYPDLQEDAFYEYMKKVKKNVQYAVKEFELRKNAFQQTRAMVKDTGTLDVNKLHSYKYNDNIFSQMTQLAQFKNHGVVMLVDWSGSMHTSLESVIDQILHMVLFCKQINVPYEVYSFTSGGWNSLETNSTVIFNRLNMCELISSNMKKSIFEEAAYWLYIQRRSHTRGHFTGVNDGMGSTPLKEALLATDHIISRFRERTNVSKVNFVCLTDGDANALDTTHGRYNSEAIRINHEGYILNMSNTYRHNSIEDTAKILEMIKAKHNTTNIGFFVAGTKRDAHYRVAQSQSPSDYARIYEIIESCRADNNKKLRKDNCIEVNNVIGYDNFFVTVEKQLSIEEYEFQSESSEKKDVMRSFRQHQTQKKSNKVLMGKIGKAFA